MKTKKQCDVCNNPVIVDEWGNGKCKNCGWWQDKNSLKYPNAINPPNFLSLNKAKEVLNNNEKFKPSFNDILKLVDRGLDISFIYKNKKYQLDKHETITFWEVDTNNYEEFENIQKTFDKLKIDDKFIKDVWDKVHHINYEC